MNAGPLAAWEETLVFIAAFAIYAIVVKRIRITRSFSLTGARARNYGIALLVTLLPVLLILRFLLSAFLPDWVYGVPGLTRVIAAACYAIVAVGLAFIFRDEPTVLEAGG